MEKKFYLEKKFFSINLRTIRDEMSTYIGKYYMSVERIYYIV